VAGHGLRLQPGLSGWVFGYGSLAAAPGSVPATLHGWRRRWGVAMDNAVAIPGYKVYLDAGGGRPDVCVAFLDVVAKPGADVKGVCVPVDAAALAALDHRERNYERADVTADVTGGPRGRVWTYVGRDDSRARFAAAAASGRCVIVRSYLDVVEAGLGGPLPRDGLPVAELRRVDLPNA
jgi:cation transport regulator ChaC